jgi:tetratricopeptide (TPR) repeat protein
LLLALAVALAWGVVSFRGGHGSAASVTVGRDPADAGMQRAALAPGVGTGLDGAPPTAVDAGAPHGALDESSRTTNSAARGGQGDDARAQSDLPDEPPSPAEAKNRTAVELAARGESTQAIALLREAHALEPGNALYAKNLQAALINVGFAEIAAEDCDQAVAKFVEARRLGDRAEIGRGLGYAYYRLGNLDLARTTLEQALASGGDDVETYLTLGRIYLERHDQEHALAMLDRAVAAGADRPGLAATVERLRRDAEAERNFQSLASSHFVLKFEGRENTGAGRIVLNALEDAYRRVGARFAYYPLERLEVILYPDEEFRGTIKGISLQGIDKADVDLRGRWLSRRKRDDG